MVAASPYVLVPFASHLGTMFAYRNMVICSCAPRYQFTAIDQCPELEVVFVQTRLQLAGMVSRAHVQPTYM
jgi:hypothetical protein